MGAKLLNLVDKYWTGSLGALIIFLLGTVLGAFFEEWLGGAVIAGGTVAIVFVVVMLALMTALLREAVYLMRRLNSRVGIKVRYIENDGSGRVYIKCRNVVMKARKSIWVLNSPMIEAPRDHQDLERTRYYESLFSVVESQSELQYYRIVQYNNDKSNLQDLNADPIHSAHLRKMGLCKNNPRHSHRVLLKKCPANRLSTFVLIDGEHLIWQINNVEFIAGKERLNLLGVFIIHDPLHRITEQFEKYFHGLFVKAEELGVEGDRFY